MYLYFVFYVFFNLYFEFTGLIESMVMLFILLRRLQSLSFNVFLLPCLPTLHAIKILVRFSWCFIYPLHASFLIFFLISLCSLIFNEISLLIICPLSLLCFFTSGKSDSVVVFYQFYISFLITLNVIVADVFSFSYLFL